MIQIRPEQPGDIISVHTVNELAFSQPTESNLVDRLRAACPDAVSLVMVSEKIKPLTQPVFHQALNVLKDRDTDLGDVLSTLGPPPMWKRDPGFPTLVQIILEQQVSLSSARAAFNRLMQTVPILTPSEFLRLDGKTLKQIGFSRQKAYYCSHLANAIMSGSLNLDGLKRMEDEQARAELIKITGIGRWTADIYLLMALRRPDVWPIGDLALSAAVQQVKGLGTRPSAPELEMLSMAWEPWRAVAARIFWHHYLNGPSQLGHNTRRQAIKRKTK